ncbi:MAG: LTA synthase family protein [Synergistaceae bacterium]|nr:LTA synthase family protein [Synergistaceae bacterium]
MKISSDIEKLFGKNELNLVAVVALFTTLKFFTVDYRIADVLNWATFGSHSLHVIRHGLRAAAVLLPSFAAVVCVMVPVSLAPRRWRGWLVASISVLFSVLVVTDTLFIRYYSDIFIFHDIMLVPQTGLIVKSIWSLLKPWDFLLFADIPLAWFLLKKKHVQLSFARVTARRVAFSMFVLFIAVSIQLVTLCRLQYCRPKIINAMYDRLSVCAWVSTSSFHWGDVIMLGVRALKPSYVPPEKIHEIKVWLTNSSERSASAPAKDMNLIYVQCEALQYFVVGLEVDGVEITPHLNKFSKECLYFTRAWDQTAGGQSSDAEFMANTSMYPAASGAAYTRFANNTYNSIARVLRKRGYTAVSVQGTASAFWNCHRMHPKLKFNKQYSSNTYPNEERIGLGLSDKEIFKNAVNIFRRSNKPFFGFIITLSGHHPYDFEGLDDGSLVLPPKMKDTMVGNYLIAMHYFDKQFGAFINDLRRYGLLDKSLIVLYGDHPALPIAYKKDMSLLLGNNLDTPLDWKKTRRVPLMFRIPSKVSSAHVDETDTGQMDILPTTAGLMGVKFNTAFGKDLLAQDVSRPVIFRNGSYIYKGTLVDPGALAATDMATGEKLDYAAFDKITEETERSLAYSDLILEKDLIKDITKH